MNPLLMALYTLVLCAAIVLIGNYVVAVITLAVTKALDLVLGGPEKRE